MPRRVRICQREMFAVLLATSYFFAQPLFASEKLDTLGRSAIQDSVAAVVCGDQRLKRLSELDYDACLAKSESVASYCWRGIRSLLPDLRFGEPDFSDQENQDRVLSTFFILEKCLQASILLPNDGTQNEVSGDANADVGSLSEFHVKEQESGEAWEHIIEDAKSDYAKKRNLVPRISSALLADDFVTVTVDSDGNALAFKNGQDGSLRSVSDNLQFWSEVLAAENVHSASRTDDGVFLSVDSELTTDLHRLEVSYISTLEPSLPPCAPNLRHIPCGTCEIDRSEDSRAILTWYSRDIETIESQGGRVGDSIDLSNHMSRVRQCWKQGMLQLGFDADFIDVSSNKR